MEKELLIKKVSESLEEIYQKYSSQGVLVMYIWGSILTSDFDFQTSDIDAIAIVNDRVPIEFESKIQKELAEKHPDIKKFGFRIIYKSELDTGIVKGNLATVIRPPLLLLDLPVWRWVCGTTFSQSDFNQKVPTHTTAKEIVFSRFARDKWVDINSIKPDSVQYFIKNILRFIQLNQLERSNLPYTALSYSELKKNNDDASEAEIVDLCLRVKSSNWNYDEFEKYKNEFEKYILKGI